MTGPTDPTTAAGSSPSSDPGTVIEERRAVLRKSRKLSVTLTAMGSSDGMCCTAEDICEGGLFLRVPVMYGLTVGQRCALNFGEQPESSGLSSLEGQTCYATVVRTEHRAGGPEPMLGAGLRFDQPLFL